MKSEAQNHNTGAGTTYRHVGLSLLVMSAVAFGGEVLLGVILTLLHDSGYDYTNLSWVTWLVSFLPVWIGYPIYLSLMRRLPAEPTQPTTLGGKNFWLLFLMCLPIMYGGNILGTLLSKLLSGGTVENAIATLAVDPDPLKIIVLVVLIPLLEELVFRKQIIDRCGIYGEKTAILFSALTFALYHKNLFQFFYTFGLGWMFAYVYTRTRRLRYPVIMHMIVNFMGSVLAPWILSKADLEALDQITSGAIDEAVMAEAMPGLILFGGYTILLLGLSIAGLVLLIVQARKFVFLPTSDEISKGHRFQTVYYHVGIILFAVWCIGMCVYNSVR